MKPNMLKKSLPIIILLPIFYLFQINRLQTFEEAQSFELSPSCQFGLFEPFEVDSTLLNDLKGFSYKLDSNFTALNKILFKQDYYTEYGILTFRGGPFRDGASRGILKGRPSTINKDWVFSTKRDTLKDKKDKVWGGGAGWTGQPSIVLWPAYMLQNFDSLHQKYKTKKNFKEVIIGSLSRQIYFIDLESGKASRTSIPTKNPIKGSVSIRPGAIPLLFTGQGIPLKTSCGMMIFNLNNHELLLYRSGSSSFAPRGWTAFDSSPLVDEDNNTLFWPGENGLIYQQKLDFSRPDSIPLPNRFKYKLEKSRRYGIESSMAACRNLGYITDNDGNLLCIDLQTFKVVWTFFNLDDTDASPVVEEKYGKPYVYTGNEVDIQGDSGFTYIRKFDGLNGHVEWENKFKCFSIRGESPVNGGMLATPLLGKNKANDLLIVSLAHYPRKYKGELIALNRNTGEIVFRFRLKSFSWSSPIDLYDEEGNMYIFTADSDGNVYLIDGSDGTLIDSKFLGVSFDASPASWDNKVVLAGRGNQIFCFSIE